MIGLGSNRLSVCRRGGMSVTQAGRGGMEWLAGGRMPSWASPYSAQATAALKAQFPTQWPTIRDYGFAHPEIVGYMNAYAPEDAKIAYSLVEGIGARWIQTDGASAINTQINASPNIGFNIYSINTGSGTGTIVYGGSNVGRLGMSYYNPYTSYVLHYQSTYHVVSNYPTSQDWHLFTHNVEKGKFLIDGVQKTTWTWGSDFSGDIWLFSYLGTSELAKCKMTYVEFVNNQTNEQIAKFVPYVSRTQGNGLLDLVSGIFYPKTAGSGSFTISETPAP